MRLLERFFRRKSHDLRLDELPAFLDEVLQKKDFMVSWNSLKKRFQDAKDDCTNILESMMENKDGEFKEENERFRKHAFEFLEEAEFPSITNFSTDVTKFEGFLNSFHKAASKSFYVLEGNLPEVDDFNSGVKMLESAVVDAKEKTRDRGIMDLRIILQKVSEMSRIHTDRKELMEDLKVLRSELMHHETKKQELSLKFETIKKSQDYNEFSLLEIKKLDIEEQINDVNRRLISDLNTYLDKTKKYSDEKKLLTVYVENPLKALYHDPNLQIFSTLEKIRKEFPDLKFISKSEIESIKSRYEEQRKTRNNIISQQSRMKVMMDYRELEYQIEHNERKIELIRKEIESKDHTLGQIDSVDNKRMLEEKIISLTGLKVELIA